MREGSKKVKKEGGLGGKPEVLLRKEASDGALNGDMK